MRVSLEGYANDLVTRSVESRILKLGIYGPSQNEFPSNKNGDRSGLLACGHNRKSTMRLFAFDMYQYVGLQKCCNLINM